MALADTIPPLLKQGRRDAGLSQAELAERVGVTQPTISRWESGKELPSLPVADFVLRELGISIDVIWTPLPDTDDGVDRAQIQRRLRSTPRERLAANAALLRFARKARSARRA
jgi:transcriptional regulator with XRE-family HTH domain